MEPIDARRLWWRFEPLHALVYFAPQARAVYGDAGLKGGWMGYFASRAAALGPVGPEVVRATFYGFAAPMVQRAIPDAWRFSDPARVLAARNAVASAAIGRAVTGADPEAVAEAGDLALAAARAADPAGRALFAAHLALPVPDDPALRLWHAVTLLREHRGDGHVAALVAADLDGCEAHVTVVARGDLPREALQPMRGWTDDDWVAASKRLRARGWVDEQGTLTEEGRVGRAAVETATDVAALRPLRALGDEGLARLSGLLDPLAARVREEAVPSPNPIGVPASEPVA